MPIPGTTTVPAKIAPSSLLDTYATHDEQFGQGGFRTVATITDRNNIPNARRKEGMIVMVKSPRKFYQLGPSLLDADWYEVALKSCPEYVATLADLKQIAKARCGGIIRLLGLNSALDGGGGWLYWDPTITGTELPIVLVFPNDTDGTGGWRQFA